MQAIIGPQIVLAFATSQRVAAKRSVKDFKAMGYPTWTLRHAFYANMGGFVLQPRDNTRFPINSRHLQYLIAAGYIDIPTITEKEIWDKSKADGFAKLLTCFQTGWFVVETVGRAIQHLPITPLDFTTLGFVVCTFGMHFQWAEKPLNVQSPTIINIEASTADILISARDAASEPYRWTPLDFIDNQPPSWLTEVQSHLKFGKGSRQRPLSRFSNDRFPDIGVDIDVIVLCLIILIYEALHFAGWNFSFPTRIEEILWRASCVTMVASTIVFLTCGIYQDGHRMGRWKAWYVKLFPSKTHKHGQVDTAEMRRRQAIFIPMWEVVLMAPIVFIYTLACSYIVVEVFVSLRSLPLDAFQSMQWSNWVPHVWMILLAI